MVNWPSESIPAYSSVSLLCVLCLSSTRLLVNFAILVWRLMNSPLTFLSARRLMNLVCVY